MITKNHIKSGIFACMVLCMALVFSTSAYAAADCVPGLPCVEPSTEDSPKNTDKSDSKSCDADFMNQMYARSFLEASRETTMNQAILRKPDSVLEYTCFGKQAENAASGLDGIFSGGSPGTTTIPGPPPVTTRSLPNLVNDLIADALEKYITNNFGHSYLGGAMSPDPPAGNTCSIMKEVYNAAKCSNMPESPFITFKSLIDTDPRILPPGYECALPAPPEIAPFTQAMIDVSENKDLAFVKFDKMDTYLKFLQDPAACPGPAIPTGVIIQKTTLDNDPAGNPIITPAGEYIERICPNLKCYYKGSGETCAPSGT
ncbi:MAG: hypothetical protein ACT4OY_03180 [Alphaproteobacteria bacterium]